MGNLREDIVRVAIGSYLGVPPHAIDASARLEQDLGLDASDIVLIMLRLEEMAEAELASVQLERVVTVADLQEIVRAWARERLVDDTDELADAQRERPSRHASGIQRIAQLGRRQRRAS